MKTLKSFFRVLSFLLFSANVLCQNTFEQDIELYAESINLPGIAVGVVKNGKLVFFKAIGKADSANTEEITPDHIFQIASITKTLTAVLLQNIESEGKLNLTDHIDKYPNKYFTPDRWTPNTTLAHIISQTSESEPIGENFAYNGSKYNLIYNALSGIYNLPDSDGIYRPFCIPMEEKILIPLGMNYSLTRYNEREFGHLKNWIICPSIWDGQKKIWKSKPINMKNMQSGPGFGMMSSMNDLMKYSNAIDQNIIISKEQYQKITTPFYEGSPYGMGWFIHDFEGVKMHWAYGYGDSDASILLKIPSYQLTLIVLSTSTLPSESTRMGYGNPLNSPLVCSFLRNYIKSKTSEFDKKIAIEERFSQAEVQLFAPSGLATKKNEAVVQLIKLIKSHPKSLIWYTPTAFELLAKSDDETLMNFALSKYESIKKQPQIHPAILFYSGEVAGKLGKNNLQIEAFSRLSNGDSFKEQSYKMNAMMWLGKNYISQNQIDEGKKIFQRLKKYKEFISSLDGQYQEIKEILNKM